MLLERLEMKIATRPMQSNVSTRFETAGAIYSECQTLDIIMRQLSKEVCRIRESFAKFCRNGGKHFTLEGRMKALARWPVRIYAKRTLANVEIS